MADTASASPRALGNFATTSFTVFALFKVCACEFASVHAAEGEHGCVCVWAYVSVEGTFLFPVG